MQPIGGSANGMAAARRADDIRVLGEIKRDNRKKLDKQRAAYMQLLDYVLDRAKLQNKKFKELMMFLRNMDNQQRNPLRHQRLALLA